MKKVLSLVMAIMVLVCTLSIRVGAAQAAGLITYRGGLFVWGKGVVFVFDAAGYRNKDVRNANIFAGSNFHNLYCTVNKEEEKIVCVGRGSLTQYAGETGVIYLGKQIFYVIIPARPELPEPEVPVEEALTCEEPEVLGATVTFEAGEGDPQSFFLAGETLQEVQNSAVDLMDAWEGFFSNPDISEDGITCGIPDSFGFFE